MTPTLVGLLPILFYSLWVIRADRIKHEMVMADMRSAHKLRMTDLKAKGDAIRADIERIRMLRAEAIEQALADFALVGRYGRRPDPPSSPARTRFGPN